MKRTQLYTTFAIASAIGATLSGATTYVDIESRNSLFLENFSSGDPSSQSLNGISFKSSSRGVGSYEISDSIDPQLYFDGYAGGLDFADFPNVRIRHRFAGKLRNGSVYPLPMSTVGPFKYAINGSMVTRQVTLTGIHKSGTGLRLDPVDGEIDEGNYFVDYIMLDRGRTIGFEFDQSNSTRGGVNNYFVGSNLDVKEGKEIVSGVSDGLFYGNPTSSDPKMILYLAKNTGLSSIDTGIYKYIEIRMRVPSAVGGTASVFYRTGANSSGDAHKVDIILKDDSYFHTYLLDMSNVSDWTVSPVNYFRLDPINSQAPFEIDYIRFYETVKIN